MAGNSDRLYVTYVEAYNGLLKIWGQPNRTCATYIEKQLLQLAPELNRSPGLSPSSIQKGMIYIAKHEDETYYRARIISDVVNNAVLVFFIDYGNKDRVDLCHLRMLGNPTESIISTIVPQAEEYFLANIKSDGGWSQDVMNEIRRGLCCSEYKYRTVCQSGSDKLIQISYRNEDYSSFLIRQELAKPVSVKEQMILLNTSFKNQSMEPMGNTFRSPNFNQQLPQPSSRDKFFIPNKVHLGATAHDRLNQPGPVTSQPLLPQPIFTQPQNRSVIDRPNGERHFNVVNPPLKTGFSQSSNTPALSDSKSSSVINTVVIEALANQLKQHLLKDQLTSVPEASAHGYFSQVLDVKTTHNVYISYIDDGPWSFSIQLVSNEHELNQLMEDLAAYNFQPIKLPLTLGSPCIAKSKKYDGYCRGVLVNITHSAVKVFYVDFGNTEDLPYNMLFEIPTKFFKFKTMSQKFALSGLQRVKPTEEIKNAFAEVVENELLILHVTNLEGENLPTCDLYLKDVNIKKILNEKLRLVKNWDPIQFPRPGEIENVLVTYVETPQRFFVQLKRCEPELKELKAELGKFGGNAETFDTEEIVPGTICISYYTQEKNWYRAVVTSVNSAKTVTVFYVDYGYTEMVDVKMLRKVCGGIISKTKIQAIPCCLHGYEGGFRQSSNKSALTELILGKEFSLKVVSEGNECINVQLFDNGKDVLLDFKNITMNSKQKSLGNDTKDKSDNYASDSDSVKKRSSPNGKTGLDKMDSGKGRGKKDLKPEKGKGDLLSWRSEERKESGPKPKDDSKNIKARDAKEPASETKNEKAESGKNDDNKSGRYGFKGKKNENSKVNDKDQKNVEKNWRGIENVGGKTAGGDGSNKTKSGESINDRMKRAAKENEVRGLKMKQSLKMRETLKMREPVITRLPVKLENMAFGGKIRERKEIKPGTKEKVIVTYFVNPQEMYVQMTSCKEKFKKFMSDIRQYYSTKLPMLNKPKKGDVVMCKFKEDGVLYRALVIENDPITVQYVDFGNEEVSERENLWPMDKRFLELESQCLKCTLPNIKPVGSDTWPAPNGEMDKMFESETYYCTFLKKIENGYEVKLVNVKNGKDVRDELISAGFADLVEDSVEESVQEPVKDSAKSSVPESVKDSVKPSAPKSVKDSVKPSAPKSVKDSVKPSVPESVKDSNGGLELETKENSLPMIKMKNWSKTPFDLLRNEVFNVFVTHIVDVSEFYIQIKCSESKALEKDILKFIGEEKFRACDGHVSVNNGDLCLVNVESSNWYRAEVIEKTETNITVTLIDHGYKLVVNREQIGPISDDLTQYSPQAIRCCLLFRGDTPNNELNADFSSCVKKNFSAFFHDESDNGLKVTLYDTFGEKLKILHTCNNAPVWIRAISDLPIIKRRMQVTVSHIDSPKEVYVQLLNDDADLKQLISLMMVFYNDKEEPELSGNLSEFEMYAVKSPTDGTWYRAQMISHNDESAKMFFLDFGNSEEVPRKNLRKLDSSFYEWYAYAKKVSLNLFYPRIAEKRITVKLHKLIGKKVCPAYFVKLGNNLNAEFVLDDSFLTSQLVSSSVRILREGLFEKYKSTDNEIKVYISHVSCPEEFWVHEEIICSELTAFQDKLQAACSNGKPKNDIEVGDIVGALFKDNSWYRALVTAVEGDIISIRFLDYGNTFKIDKRENVFMTLSEELKKRPSFARKCSLQGSWRKNTTYRFEDIVLCNSDTFELIEIDDQGDIVDLLQNGSSVTEQLINEGFKGRANDDVVYITHINSPTDFYVQKEVDQEVFDRIIENMIEADSLQNAYNVVMDEVYCARFPEDDLWYRAKVICIDREDVVVSFIDYGNCSIVTEIKDMPHDLKIIPPLSKNCCLVNLRTRDNWSDAAKDYFWKFLNDVPLNMEIIQQTSEIDVIRLTTYDGEDVSEKLASMDGGIDQIPEHEFGMNDIINGENMDPLLFGEGITLAGRNDSCPNGGGVNLKENDDASTSGISVLSEKSQNILNPEGIVSGLVNQGESASKEDEKSEFVRKLSSPEKVVAGSVITGLPLEEVSDPDNTKAEEKLTRCSPTAPVTPSAAGQQQQQEHERSEEEDKPSPGAVSNGNVCVASQDKIIQDKKKAASNANDTVGDKKN